MSFTENPIHPPFNLWLDDPAQKLCYAQGRLISTPLSKQEQLAADLLPLSFRQLVVLLLNQRKLWLEPSSLSSKLAGRIRKMVASKEEQLAKKFILCQLYERTIDRLYNALYGFSSSQELALELAEELEGSSRSDRRPLGEKKRRRAAPNPAIAAYPPIRASRTTQQEQKLFNKLQEGSFQVESLAKTPLMMGSFTNLQSVEALLELMQKGSSLSFVDDGFLDNPVNRQLLFCAVRYGNKPLRDAVLDP